MQVINQQFIVERDDYANAGKVSSQVKQTLNQIGIPGELLRRVAVACYEAEINMIIHAWGGTIQCTLEDNGELTLTFKDPGPGIPNIDKALTPGWSTASEKARQLGFGAGMGLFNIKRVSDHFDIQTSPQGTTLTIGFLVTS
ncbi:ATP-binding protein [Anaerorhabdus furcosa]|uniref:Anti-sigma regulatory factor (Ser/Thr protein kinase) n=1 Tax=Anaerorhabdus furcosa TaxID=118967 RepID=A0A1T4PI62_9FIRM|nr:ATP-binding protein [Anaerorhabdus furcosa]SJZ91172.1 Anti-sigma regulatory factor (Ser/Thr protein kinase) [Anaerorhabdus furcosa]